MAPYGSMQNEDYAYDTWRQRKDEEMDSPIFDLAAAMARDKQRAYDHLQDFNAEARDALRVIIAARDLAPDEPIPTPLLAAIEAARRVL